MADQMASAIGYAILQELGKYQGDTNVGSSFSMSKAIFSED